MYIIDTTDLNTTTLDSNLLLDLDGDLTGYVAYEAGDYHIVYNEDTGRGGIVYMGSGSDGRTEWIDASSAEDVLDKMLG